MGRDGVGDGKGRARRTNLAREHAAPVQDRNRPAAPTISRRSIASDPPVDNHSPNAHQDSPQPPSKRHTDDEDLAPHSQDNNDISPSATVPTAQPPTKRGRKPKGSARLDSNGDLVGPDGRVLYKNVEVWPTGR